MKRCKFRNKRLVVKITNFEKKIIQKEADYAGLSVAHLIRKMIKESLLDNESLTKDEVLAMPNAFYWRKK